MPMPGDPSFAREERRARAREAAAAATPERRQELKARYEPVAPEPPPRRARRPSARSQPRSDIDVAATAAVARKALDAHPGAWTSYAELCSAAGLDRQLALVVARHLAPGPMNEHWFRVRNGDGVYHVPTDATERSDAAGFSAAEADRRLEAIGVSVVGGRADIRRKLVWTTTGWQLLR